MTVVLIIGSLSGTVSNAQKQIENQDAVLRLADEALQDAAVQREQNLKGWGTNIRLAAFRLARAGSYLDAIRVLDEVVESPESPFEAISAFRMQGQYWRAAGYTAEAKVAFQEAVTLGDSHQALVQRMPSSYLSACVQYSGMLEAEDAYREAANVNDRIVRLGRSVVGEAAFAGALLRSAKLSHSLGETNKALATLAILTKQIPSFGSEDGRAVEAAWMEVNLRHPERSSFEYIIEIEQIWADNVMGNTMHALPIGLELISLWDGIEDHSQAVQHAADVFARIDEHRKDWLEYQIRNGQSAARAGQVLDLAQLSCLSRLQSADSAGHPELAMMAIEELRKRDTEKVMQRSMELQEERVRPKLQAEKE